MKGTKAKDLTTIMDYIYHGKTNIYQEDLEGFLVLASYLQLKGSKCEVIKSKEEHYPDMEEFQQEVLNIEPQVDDESHKIQYFPFENSDSKIWFNNDLNDSVQNIGSMKRDKITSLMETFYAKEKTLKCTVCKFQHEATYSEKA